MSIELGRRLVSTGVAPSEEVQAALFLSVVRDVSFPRALIDRGVISERRLEEELARRGGLAVRNVVAVPSLVARLPLAMCRRLAAVPARLDPYTGTVDVAAADPLDPHIANEFGYHLRASIRVVRASLATVEEAIRRVELDEPPRARARSRRVTPAFPHGAPSSAPPPPVEDEVPIPLVRRAAPLIDPTEGRITGGAVSFPSSRPPPLPAVEAATTAPAVTLPPPAMVPAIVVEPPPEPIGLIELDSTLDALRNAEGRDAIVALSLEALQLLGRRVAVFAVRRDSYRGWDCNPEFGDPVTLRQLNVPTGVPSVLATATTTGMYLGPLPTTAAHEGLRAVMGEASRDLAVVTVRVAGRPAMLLVADELDDTLRGTRAMDEIAVAAGQALEQLF